MMKKFQQRVIDEKKELDGKLNRLKAFFDTKLFNELPSAEQSRLRRQLLAMTKYSRILEERIIAFGEIK